MIYRWQENSDILFLNEAQISPRIADRKNAMFPRLEAELMQYVREVRKKKFGINKENLCRRALELSATCIENDRDREKFKASKS